VIEWGFKARNKLRFSVGLLIPDGFSHDISPHLISSEIIVVFFITKLIGDIIDIFFIIIVFAMIGRGVNMVKWTVLWIMLRLGSFAVFAAIVGTERFEVACSLTLVADASSHVRGKDLVDKER
jgi:hypothetical protein